MMEGVRFDFGNMMAPRLDGGVTGERLEGAFAERFRAAHARFESRKEAGELGFLELPYATEDRRAGA
jgi:hypothetical protein